MKTTVANTKKISRIRLSTLEATISASSFFFLMRYSVKIGIKAADKAPVIRIFAIKSGITKAVLKASSGPEAPK